MNDKKLYSLLGLAAKAGRIASGEFAVEKAGRSDRASLIVVAETASENTKKKFRNMCNYHGIPLYFFGTHETLGRATGKVSRASLAILDDGFAKAFEREFGALHKTD